MGKNNRRNWKKRIANFAVISLCLVIAVVLISYSITIFYSYPSQDDFQFWGWMKKYGSGHNEFSGAVKATEWLYYNWTCGIPYVFLQMICNPLLYFPVDSYAYGIQQIIVFNVFWIILFVYIRFVLQKLFGVKQFIYVLGTFTALLISILNCSIFTEIFYWYTGRIYEIALAFAMINHMLIIKVFETEGKKSFVWIAVASVEGYITCFNYQIAVMIGFAYVFHFFCYNRGEFKKKKNIAKIIPLLFMIAGGLISVLGPGNYVRQSLYIPDMTVFRAVKMAVKTTLKLYYTMYICNPAAIIALAFFAITGYLFVKNEKRLSPLVLGLAGGLASYLMLFPIALGQGNEVIYNRMLYFCSVPSFVFQSITALLFGSYIKKEYSHIGIALTKRNKRDLLVTLAFLGFLTFAIANVAMKYFPVKPVNNPIAYTMLNVEKARSQGELVKKEYSAICESEQKECYIDTVQIGSMSPFNKEILLSCDDDWWVNEEMSFYFGKTVKSR